eukprot:CAMPEP_0170547584 /NCGR_PEP_ID=MMETSP0211-20121228/5994_1 /TAXON_ID=311385 /ORGANISM="Pseudokeronopsis sp., Strain OXSARD2" /LENGTH=71 /DNA_ID=CAMNT_0010852721 /DNA_START=885 /DNA_END=1100 /DNA_ORIENTATION=+
MFEGEENVNELEFQDDFLEPEFFDDDDMGMYFFKAQSMYNKENIPNLLNDMNDEDPDAFYSKFDESNALSD